MLNMEGKPTSFDGFAITGKEQNTLDSLPLESLSHKESEDIFSQIQIHGAEFNGKTLTKDILKENNLLPHYKIEIDGVHVYCSSCYNLGSGRIAVVGYVRDKKNKMVTRSFYRSNSLGLWRYLPNYTITDGRIDWYGKGHGEASITLPIAIQQALAEISESTLKILNVDRPELVFAGTARQAHEHSTYMDEVGSIPIKIESFSIENHQKFPPQKIKISQEKSPILDPSRVIATWKQDSSLYGEINIEVVPSQDGKFKFIFCRDKLNRVWIAGIEDTSEMQSVGLRKYWVDGEDLTTPAYEYQGVVGKYGNLQRRSGSYVDMFQNYLSRIPVIQEYCKSRSIEIPTSSEITLGFEDASDWNSLFEILEKKQGLQGTKHHYASDELKEIIEEVRLGKIKPEAVTRTEGLREVVLRLLKEDK